MFNFRFFNAQKFSNQIIYLHTEVLHSCTKQFANDDMEFLQNFCPYHQTSFQPVKALAWYTDGSNTNTVLRLKIERKITRIQIF